MLCENCKKATATTHIKRSVNGVTREYHLCPECAAKLGFSNFHFFDMNDLWSTFLGNGQSAMPQTKRCRTCNTSFEEIINNGKMGCPDCYTEFREEILPTLIKIHGKTEHKGISPENSGSAETNAENTQVDEITKLENELKTAIENEEFEKAAELRDILKEKRGEING
ncbi:MAG: UvrB/UvrC motif-containing protein [Acutalibacteraceae bacterium]|nr:UvrB/UvrC motif-containing protein [Acutalibacteraceae bacterium]